MKHFPLFITRLMQCAPRVIVLLLIALALTPRPAAAGNGRFSGGTYDFCVSVRFNATDAQLAQIRSAFQAASDVFADATDGQQRFGKVTIVNDSGASATAEYWVNPGAGRAYATLGKYGKRGEHVNLYFDSNFQGSPSADGDAYTIAHEHAHHVFGVADEYSGPGGAAECAPAPDSATLNFCLMDNYFIRGGNAGAGTTYTLNEFCVASNHDPDTDTHQHKINEKSCWEVIAAHSSRSATSPAGLPASAPPASQAPSFADGFGGLRVMLVIDRSGSMSADNRIGFAKSAAKLFVNFLREGDSVGVASFSSGVSVNFPLTTIGAGTKAAVNSAIDGLFASGSTNIGGGLQEGLNQITSQPDRSCNEVIVLLSDGDHNTGTHPNAVIPSLKSEGVTTFTVAVGSGISTSGQALQQLIASETGGRYLQVTSAFSLVGLFFALSAETTDSGLLARAPDVIGSMQVKEQQVTVEPGSTSASFALAVADASDQMVLTLRSPSGAIITSNDAGVNPDIEFITESSLQAFRIRNPEAGVWTLIISAGGIVDGRFEGLAAVEHPGVQLNVSLAKDTLVFPEAVRIEATPQYEGENVLGAQVTGVVTRPNNSTVNITLLDNGLEANGDAIAGDGVYSARFSNYQPLGDGTYRFDVTAVVTGGMTYGGEELFNFEPSNSEVVPDFTRSASVSAVVSGIPDVQAPNAPTNLRITQSTPLRVDLAWDDNSEDEEAFEIERTVDGVTEVIAIVGANTVTFSDADVEPNTAYQYRVRATNGGATSDWSNQVTLTTEAAPKGARLMILPRRMPPLRAREGRTSASYVVLVNTGSAELFGEVGSLGAPFEVVSGGGPFRLPPSGRLRVLVRFSPTAGGRFEDTLVIRSTDRDQSQVNYRIRGRALPKRKGRGGKPT